METDVPRRSNCACEPKTGARQRNGIGKRGNTCKIAGRDISEPGKGTARSLPLEKILMTKRNEKAEYHHRNEIVPLMILRMLILWLKGHYVFSDLGGISFAEPEKSPWKPSKSSMRRVKRETKSFSRLA